MRCAIPHPCIDSSASVLKISRSSVPCSKSEVAAIFPSTSECSSLLSNVKERFLIGWPILRSLIALSGMTNAQPSTTHLPSLILFTYPNQRIVISTEAAHAFCERRSGEIRFSTGAPRSNSFHCPYYRRNLFFAFSAQKTHVKPPNHLTHDYTTTSAWHFSYPQP